jgi:hypothetical protein
MSESRRDKGLISKTSIIRSAFMQICADTTFRPRLWNKWLPDNIWVEALERSRLIDPDLMSTINVGTFNAAMGRSGGDFDGQMMSRYDGTNKTGIFRLAFQRVLFYNVTNKNKQVAYPLPLDESWKEGVMAVAKNVFTLPTTRWSSSSEVLLQQGPTQNSKRQKTGNLDTRTTTSVIATASPAHQDLLPTAPADVSLDTTSAGIVVAMSTSTNSSTLLLASYWNSQDACKLFGVQLNAPFDDVRDFLKLRVELLQSVNSSETGWRNVIQGRDPDDLCSRSDIFAIRGRSTILCLAYQLAILNMNKWTWEQCCTHACTQLNPLGIVQATHNRAVQDWNGIFRQHESFPHPNYAVRCGKQPLPLLFEKYPKAMDAIMQFGVKNLTTLSVESTQAFCHDTLIPQLLEQWRSDTAQSRTDLIERDNPLLTKEMFMNEHHLTTLSIPTCWRWLHRLGFTHNTQRKGYYVDGHERSDVVDSRNIFCEIYLTDVEPRCLRWIVVSQRELETTHAILNRELGYRFIDEDGESQVEFHVDYFLASHQNEENDLLEGKNPSMSVRAPPGSIPIEVFGQDESVFSQFMFPTKSWIGPNQEHGLFPKSLGEGLMISAFVSRDSGFGMPVTPEQLDEINRSRLGTDYIDKAAAIQIYSTAGKPPLKETPFVRSLLIGATKGGYWNSFHMAIQLEDVVDCLKILRPGFEFVFLFDHSQGHARKKDGALDASSMSRSFGGVQPKIRSSRIVDGCLGPFNPSLSIGDVQSMVFEENDEGPWWITTPEGRETRRHDILREQVEGTTLKLTNRTKLQLANALKDEAGVTVDPLRPMDEIKEIAILHGVDLQYQKTQITEGWYMKPKGLLQILWERGWIDPRECSTFKQDKTAGKIINTSFYTINGRKDPQTGQSLESSSLRALMA